MTCALAAGVGVHREALDARSSAASCHLDGVEDHLCAHVSRDAPAHDEPAERVDDETHIGGSGPGGATVRSVTHSRFGRPRGEVPVDEIAGALRPRVAHGGARLWVPIIRSWALTRGFALHPGTRNRYKIRYTRTQHRPASRQVNDHGRVSGTHRAVGSCWSRRGPTWASDVSAVVSSAAVMSPVSGSAQMWAL